MDKVIEKIVMHKEVEEFPDLSWLETKFDHDESTNELKILSSCRYTNEDVQKYGTAKVLQWIKDDQKRPDSYGDQWCMVGIYAEAHIRIKGTLETIRTAGLWSIESDSKSSYFDGVAHQEVSELKDILKEIGFTDEQINEARVIDFDGLESTAITVAEFTAEV